VSSGLLPGLALIFDMDGVIVDSNPLHREAWVAYNRRYQLETTEAMHQRMYGKRNDEIIRDFYGESLTEAEVQARGAAKEEVYRELMTGRLEEFLVPGVREFLQNHQGISLGMGTNAEPENVDFVLDHARLRPYFQVVVDGHGASRPKPYPDIYLKVAELLGVPPENAVVFEDSPSGVAAARAAGMRVVGVNTTFSQLRGTEFAIDNFNCKELPRWLRTLRPLV
jgi:beta-phosphoglucomutase